MDGSNDYIRRMSLSGGIDCGIVTMKDGEEVKYWFLSHHGSGDQGHARFEFPGGRVRMMTGYFCCEVMLPQDEFLSVDEFDAFLVKVDGKLSLHSKITYQQSTINNQQSTINNQQSTIFNLQSMRIMKSLTPKID
ncbi:MAG: hypothetical protein ACK6AY_05035 [Akkermansiaceae bacterium]|jgi:hypothetical protein